MNVEKNPKLFERRLKEQKKLQQKANRGQRISSRDQRKLNQEIVIDGYYDTPENADFNDEGYAES